jgi:centromeric protein E
MNPANKNLEIRESVDGILINRLTEKEVDTPQVVMAIME